MRYRRRPHDSDGGVFDNGSRPRRNLTSVDSIPFVGLPNEFIAWALRHGWVPRGCEASRYGNVRDVSEQEMRQTFLREFIGWRDAACVLDYIVTIKGVPPYEVDVTEIDLLLSVHPFVLDPIRLPRGVRQWDDPLFHDSEWRWVTFSSYPRLVRWLDSHRSEFCESPAESAFSRGWDLAHLNEILLPQYPVGRFRVDFYEPRLRVAFEIDGAQYHSSPEQVQNDADRQRSIESDEITVVRVPATQVLMSDITTARLCEALYTQRCQRAGEYTVGDIFPDEDA